MDKQKQRYNLNYRADCMKWRGLGSTDLSDRYKVTKVQAG